MSRTFVFERFDLFGDRTPASDGEFVLAQDAIDREAVLQAQIRTLEAQLKDARTAIAGAAVVAETAGGEIQTLREQLASSSTASVSAEAKPVAFGLRKQQCNEIMYFVEQSRKASSAEYIDMLDTFRDWVNSLVVETSPAQSIADTAGAKPEPLVTLSGAQLLEAFNYVAPDHPNDPDQLECDVTIAYGEGHSGKGHYCWITDYPDEGAILLDGKQAEGIAAPPAPSVADADIEAAKRSLPVFEDRFKEITGKEFGAPSVADAAGASDAEFKNFHRLLCERFGYTHDEKDWRRDQLSLIEHIAAKKLAQTLPAELTPPVRRILGMMLWETTPIANALRAGGRLITRRVEDEQAAALHWLLGFALEHGMDWEKPAAAALLKMTQGIKD